MEHRVIAINDYVVDGVIVFKAGESYLINEVLIHKNRSSWIASKRISNELIYLNKCFYIDEKDWDVYYYKNMSVENGYGRDSLIFDLFHECHGMFSESGVNNNFIHRLRIIGEDSNIWYMSTNNFKLDIFNYRN